jgi:3-deoxy-manno-octulosonate cytidylyltransferase (CMP-KDO synthetase)
MSTKVVVIIPARWGSTRFPGKALHLIAGKPLVQHVWERCRRARGVDDVIIATDEQRIVDAAVAFGAEVALTSPKHQSGTDRIAEVARRLRGVSHVINVQGDEPVIEPALISRLARTMVGEPDLQMITAANKFAAGEDIANPNAVKVVLDRAGNALYFSRRAIPFVRGDGERPQFFRHQGIYGYSLPFLLQFVRWKSGVLERAEQLEQLRALENGAKIRVVITQNASVGVDSPEDVPAAERLLTAAKKRRT